MGFVAVWEPVSNTLRLVLEAGKGPRGQPAFSDLDRDGYLEMVMFRQEGIVDILNNRFKRIDRITIPNLRNTMFNIIDWNRDGEREILLTGQIFERPCSFILNRNLEILACSKDAYIYRIVRRGLSQPVLCIGQRWEQTVNSYLFSIEETPPGLPHIPWGWFLTGMIAGILLIACTLALIFPAYRFKKSRRLMQGMLNSLETAAFLIDDRKTVFLLNRRMVQLFHVTPSGVEGQNYETVLTNLQWSELADGIRDVIDDPETYRNKSFRVYHGDETTEYLVWINAFYSPAGKKMLRLVVVQDISELAAASKAVAWATMAQRMAHEIKTPLSTIMLTMQRMQMECEKDPDHHARTQRFINRVQDQVVRLRKMTDSFLKFSRIEKPRFGKLDLNMLIEEYLEESRFRIAQKIRLSRNLAGDLPKISADREQILIVIQNIVENSINAMGEQGILTIETSLVQQLQKSRTGGSPESVMLEISDTGRGIPREEMGRLFQPFFSRSSGGTGLGLVIVKKIVEDHYGVIRVQSEEGIGTSIFILLPVKH
jgi:signal transduction histidine kinase